MKEKKNQEVILDPVKREQISTRVSTINIIGNFVLTCFKLFAGITAHSGAMVSDAIHSASDTLSTIIVLVSMKFATKPADKEHPYGHERIECVAAMLLAIFLFFVGGGIGLSGAKKVIGLEEAVVPGLLALVAAFVSIVVKESMYHFTIHHARLIDSPALKASAWDNRSDALSSVGSFAGILGGVLGFAKLDAVASVVIAFCIIKVAYNIFKDAIAKMMDTSMSPEEEEKIRAAVSSVEGVKGIDLVMTRLFGNRSYADVEIAVDPELTVKEAHEIAHSVHDKVEAEFRLVKHCMVHVNPYKE